MKTWLLDTGPIVAYLDASDADHERVAERLQSFRGQLVTTGAVVVEAMHLLARTPSGPALLVEFLLLSRTQIFECMSPAELLEAAERMKKYADIPMDFADATLVLLAERLKTVAVCTLDRRGFRTFRTRTGKAFQLVLDV